jgi:predicted nucleic acid-binding protein
MRVDLDNCCFNRPFDDQTKRRIRIEAEAKLYVQEMIRANALELAWSYVLDYENDANPFPERRAAIAGWRELAVCDMDESAKILDLQLRYEAFGLKPADRLHLACAVAAGCEVFLTTDDGVLRRQGRVPDIRILDPAAFVRELD